MKMSVRISQGELIAMMGVSEDAIAKARDGHTSVEEVLRVTTIQAQPTESSTEQEEIHHE